MLFAEKKLLHGNADALTQWWGNNLCVRRFAARQQNCCLLSFFILLFQEPLQQRLDGCAGAFDFVYGALGEALETLAVEF